MIDEQNFTLSISITPAQHEQLLRKVGGDPEKLDYWLRIAIDEFFTGKMHGTKDVIDLSGRRSQINGMIPHNPYPPEPRKPEPSDINHLTGVEFTPEQHKRRMEGYESTYRQWELECSQIKRHRDSATRNEFGGLSYIRN